MRRYLLDVGITAGAITLLLSILVYLLFIKNGDKRSWVWVDEDFADYVLEYYTSSN